MPAPRATTYEELKAAISTEFPRLSKQLQRIARFALERPHDLALNTVASIAEAVEVQPSSLIRFANALGFDGFSEMQRLFRSHLVERSTPYRDRIAALRQHGRTNGSAPHDVLHDFVTRSIQGLEHLAGAVRSNELRAAVRQLGAAQTIGVIGLRRAFPVAAYLAYALNRMDLRVQLLDGTGGMNVELSRSLGRRDALIAVSFRNYTPETVEIAEACRKRGASVLAITDGPLSPLARFATVRFELGDDSSQPFRSLVEPLCLAQSLVVSLGHHLAERANGARRPAMEGAR